MTGKRENSSKRKKPLRSPLRKEGAEGQKNAHVGFGNCIAELKNQSIDEAARERLAHEE